MIEEEVEEIIDNWLKESHILLPEHQLCQEEEQLQKENPPPLDEGQEDENPLEDLE